jgi:hypothetical protein
LAAAETKLDHDAALVGVACIMPADLRAWERRQAA